MSQRDLHVASPSDGVAVPAPNRNGRARASSRLEHADVAVVHDWLPVYAGAERVLDEMLTLLPEASLYSLIEFLSEEERAFLDGKPVTTSFIQKLPFARSKYRYYLPFAPVAIEQFDLTEYNIVLSSSYVVAKGVLTRPDQFHISYVHSPIRYAWDLHFDYLKQGGLEWGLRSMVARLILHYMRLYDVSTANRVDVFLANSKTVARRIWKTYRRRARVVYPPVDTGAFSLHEEKEDFYLTVSRLVPYKRVDLIVEAFSEMPDKKLVVIGDGPEMKKIKACAGANVRLMGYQPQEVLEEYMQRARAFIFAAQEDFGIVPVEAQACGTPVIAYGKGGATETVVPEKTGLFFREQTTRSLQQAVRRFEALAPDLDPQVIRAQAERFSAERFRRELWTIIQEEYERFTDGYPGQI